MKVLLIYAHPEPRSLNGALKDFAVRICSRPVMKCRSPISTPCAGRRIDADDSSAPPVGEFWRPTGFQQAFAKGTQSADIVAEQESCCGPIR
jgi:NAD(P)H dehydrogenase (quinone)